jgi:hypothetical protein
MMFLATNLAMVSRHETPAKASRYVRRVDGRVERAQ